MPTGSPPAGIRRRVPACEVRTGAQRWHWLRLRGRGGWRGPRTAVLATLCRGDMQESRGATAPGDAVAPLASARAKPACRLFCPAKLAHGSPARAELARGFSILQSWHRGFSALQNRHAGFCNPPAGTPGTRQQRHGPVWSPGVVGGTGRGQGGHGERSPGWQRGVRPGTGVSTRRWLPQMASSRRGSSWWARSPSSWTAASSPVSSPTVPASTASPSPTSPRRSWR